jgi:hypothetical protein
MGKVILIENGRTIVRNATHIVRVSPTGRLGRPQPFEGCMHLVTGVPNPWVEIAGVRGHDSIIRTFGGWLLERSAWLVLGMGIARYALGY